MKKSNRIEEKYLDKIIQVAYGEGNLFEKLSVYFRAKKDPSVKNLLDEYRLTASVLDSMKNEKCPENLVSRTAVQVSGGRRFSWKLFDGLLKKPVITAAAAVLIAVIFSLYMIETQKSKPQYSKVRIMQAELEVKKSLVIIDRVFKNTRSTLENDVLKKQVSPPIREGINVVHNLFNGG